MDYWLLPACFTVKEIIEKNAITFSISIFVSVHDNYDVFIAYADPDYEFAKLLLKTLEDEPNNLRVCIDFRDFLPGVHTLEQIAEVIEDCCPKVIVILSEDFNKCEKCDFQAKVALSLSPGMGTIYYPLFSFLLLFVVARWISLLVDIDCP